MYRTRRSAGPGALRPVMPALRVYTAYFIMLIWADKPLRGICFSVFLFFPFFLPAPEKPPPADGEDHSRRQRNYDSGSYGKAGEKTDDTGCEERTRAYRRRSLLSQKVSYKQQIHRVIKLLDQARSQKRQGE